MSSTRPAVNTSHTGRPGPVAPTIKHRSEDDPRVAFWRSIIKRDRSWAMFSHGTAVAVGPGPSLDEAANAAILAIAETGDSEYPCARKIGDAWLVGPYSSAGVYVAVSGSVAPDAFQAAIAAHNVISDDRSELAVVYVSRASPC